MDNKLITIIIADDDQEDRMMIREALQDLQLKNPIVEVENGEELLHYLRHTGRFATEEEAFRSGVILLDLNMPKMDGREALREIKTDPNLKKIPVVILTTSKAEEDISKTYELGANSFVKKPVTFQGFISAMRDIGKYWFELVEVPDGK